MRSTRQGRLTDVSMLEDTKVPAVRALLDAFGQLTIDKSITFFDLFSVYMFLRKKAELTLSETAGPSQILENSAKTRVDLTSEVAAHTKLSKEKAEKIMQLLTYVPSKGTNIWISPLCAFDDRIVLVLPALALSNVVRFIELSAIKVSD